jgi:prolyl 4-hydroxylase
MSGDTQQLEARAQAGDVAAQFELAGDLDRAGRRAEATTWLESAATGGHSEALALLAIADLQGIEGPANVSRALERLTKAVSLGGNSARRLLAVLTAIGIAGAPDWSKGLGLLVDAGKAGDWQALRELGLLVEMALPGSPIADDLLLRAGIQGDGLAAFAVMRRQTLSGRTLATERVFEQWRAGIARIGHPLVEQIASVVASPDATPARPGPVIDWDRIGEALARPPGLDIAAPAALSDKPFIRRFNALLTVEECEYLIGISARLLAPAGVVDKTTGQPKQSLVRTNSVAVFWPVHQDLAVHAINLRLASAVGLAAAKGEMLNVLMYRPGEEYRPHFDFFPLEIAKADPNGQRIRTLLVYLNTGYDGGETHFITAGKKVKGDAGDGVLFHNCDAAGAPDRTTLHAGLPVVRGQKWLLSKWYRENTFVT